MAAPVLEPDAGVVEAFGGTGSVSALDGGQGHTFGIGDLVLKRVVDEDEAIWAAQVLSRVKEDGFRVPRPIQSSHGSWVVNGWTAFERVAGEHRLWGGPWPEAVDVCGRFHAALRHLARPDCLRLRQDRFARADRSAWSNSQIDLPSPVAETIARLRTMSRSIELPAQIVHGDLAGNLLYADDLPPAVIDFSPYWRPAGYATAMTIVDAVLWYGADVGLTSQASHVLELDQLLLRGLIFRLTLDGLQRQSQDAGINWSPSQVTWDLEHAEPLIAHIALISSEVDRG
jgi:uncharacterized protein (TIGR02569 family)